eukprot:10771793-Alexandrium_andersonii.AAC.1
MQAGTPAAQHHHRPAHCKELSPRNCLGQPRQRAVGDLNEAVCVTHAVHGDCRTAASASGSICEHAH